MKALVLIFLVLIFSLPCLVPGQSLFPEIPSFTLQPPKTDYSAEQDPMQSRLFRTTTLREQINLAGLWDFITDPDSSGLDKKYYMDFPEPETQLWVPGTWNAIARYWQYQGPAWLHRTFELPHDGILRLRFDGAFYKTVVWLDGQLLGEHEGGYAPFDFISNSAQAGRHSLVVLVDNSLNEQTLPQDQADWFPYGGLYRPVYAEFVPEIHIDKFHILPDSIDSGAANLKIKVFVRNTTGQSTNKEIAFFVNGIELHRQMHKISGQTGEISFIARLKNPRLWSPHDPCLYLARLVLGKNQDDQFERFGIRTFTAQGAQILLNGKPFKLMGANHHDDHPDWGSAMPPHLIRQDIEILKRMRANAVRCHYPPSELFLDYCDQSGLVFMNEIPSWQYRPEQLAQEVLKAKIKRQYYEMVYRDMNHPCIITWSLGNEWRDFEKSYNDIKELVEYARSVDTSHFITFITGGAETDRCHELIDIICTNWSVYQWYWDGTVLDPKIGERSIAMLNEIHQKYPDKPVILSEFGGSSSQAGWHNWGNVKWSEEYQARNVLESGKIALETDWISGGCVWQFCDTRTTPLRILGPRLRGWNAKGVVDGYRQPKMAFYVLQQLSNSFLHMNPH